MDDRRARVTLWLLALGALAAVVAFMVLGAQGSWGFVLPFRGRKLAALLLVAHAIAWSTVLFQTLTANRILTPAIMGFDALFVLCQTLLTALLGAAGLAALDPRMAFLGNCAVMIGGAMALFGWLFERNGRGLHRLLLLGMVVGVFLRSLASSFAT